MNKIDFKDIYDQQVDLNELIKYYKTREKEEQEKKKKEIKEKLAASRDRVATALKIYFNILDPENDVTIEELKKALEGLEKSYICDDNGGGDRGYTAVKDGDKDWDIKFKGEFTREEKNKILDMFKKVYS